MEALEDAAEPATEPAKHGRKEQQQPCRQAE